MKFESRRCALSILVLVGLGLGLGFGCAPAPTRGGARDNSLVTAEDLAKHPNESIESVIQRKVPGLAVARTADGSLILQVRGASSLLGEPKPPLYIMNGLPITAGSDGALTGIDPYNIESIKVLRGAETAIYGVDGANGVIVITTKKPAPRKH